MDWDSELIEPIKDVHVSLLTQQIENCKTITEKPVNWWGRHGGKMYVGLIVLTVLGGTNAVIQSAPWWSYTIDFVVAVLQVGNYLTWKKTNLARQVTVKEWRTKQDGYERKLREIDPGNPALQDVIEEEP